VDAKIALANSSQDGVGNSVSESISIRVAFGTSRGGNLHAADDQRPTLNQAMCIVTDADAKHGMFVSSQWLVVSGSFIGWRTLRLQSFVLFSVISWFARSD
jgi:hypothetical protein